jgi:hypothetical protein
MKTNFGDLRSAVHAEQNREPRIKDVLATYEGDPHGALSYVRDNGVLNIVSKWEGENEFKRISPNPIYTLHRLRNKRLLPDKVDLDGGDLRGFVCVGGQNTELIHIGHNPMLYQQWALDHVRIPTMEKYWEPWFNEATMKRPDELAALDKTNNTFWDLIGVHHRQFIAGEIDAKQWNEALVESKCGAKWLRIHDSAAWQALLTAKSTCIKDTTLHAALASVNAITPHLEQPYRYAAQRDEEHKLGAHLQSWLIDRFGWNAWGGVQ